MMCKSWLVLAALALMGCEAFERLGPQHPPEDRPRETTREEILAAEERPIPQQAGIFARSLPPEGSYLVEASGYTLYVFSADEPGERSACEGACAQTWSPLRTREDPHAGALVDDELLGTLERPDGTRQVTYGGWPLYTFAGDVSPGRVAGRGNQSFGGEWNLLSAEGEPLTTEQHARR
jgi:predicted lipoprotein with Yx(FWY)xxD motif